MFVHYRTNAIALKKEGRGEADELFTFYAKDFGKLEVLGRSIRKIDSKLRAGTDIFYLSEIEFIQGRGRKTLTDAILIEKLGRIRNNLPKLKIAHNISEALDSLVRGQEPDEKIWQLAKEAFERLNDWEIEPPGGEGKLEIIYYYFLWKLISALG
ncbi:MAG: DNA repair protein RecO, partial [bacterium]|nr:DNA repair protein RecO [bacterium]